MALRVDVTERDEVMTKKKLVLEFTVLENVGTDDAPEWEPKDITGMALRWVLVKHGALPTTTPLLDKNTGDGGGITIVDGPAGRCQVVAAKTEMTMPAGGRGVYDHELSETTDGVTLAYGGFVILQSPT